MSPNEILTAEIIEKELIDVELYVVDIVTGHVFRNLSEMEDVGVSNGVDGQILVLEDDIWVNKNVSFIIDTYAIHNETPNAVNPLPSATFETVNEYRTETLQVFLNGMKIHDSEITKVSDTQFSLPLDAIISDKIEVAYLKKS